MDITRFPRRHYTHGMIPIERLDRFSQALGVDGPTAGLIDLARKGVFKKGENVLFLHTGGTPGLFARPEIFA